VLHRRALHGAALAQHLSRDSPTERRAPTPRRAMLARTPGMKIVAPLINAAIGG
jgi:hypothetical protein